MAMSSALAEFLASTAEQARVSFLDAFTVWQSVDGDLAAYMDALDRFDPSVFYAATLA